MRGLKNHATKKALFREDKLTYDLAYKIVAAIEEAEKNARQQIKLVLVRQAAPRV